MNIVNKNPNLIPELQDSPPFTQVKEADGTTPWQYVNTNADGNKWVQSSGSSALTTDFKNTINILTEPIDGIYLQTVDIVGTGTTLNPQYKADTKYVIIDGVISEFTGSSTPPITEITGALPNVATRVVGFFYRLVNSADTAVEPNGLYEVDSSKNFIYRPIGGGSTTSQIENNLTISTNESNSIILGNDGVIKLTKSFYILGKEKTIKIIAPTGTPFPKTFTLANYQYLTLDYNDFTSEDANYRYYEFTKLKVKNTTTSKGNIILAGYYNNTDNFYDWTGLFAENNLKNQIKRTHVFNNLKYVSGRVTFSDDMKSCFIHSELEFLSRDGKIMVVAPTTYPYELKFSNHSKSFVLDISSNVVSEDYIYKTFDETAIKEVYNYQLKYLDKILLLSPNKKRKTEIGAGLLFDTYFDKGEFNNIRTIGNGLSNTSEIVSESNISFAHDSQLYIIKNSNSRQLRFITYNADDTSATEADPTGYTRLKVQDNLTGQVLFNDVIFRGGNTYGTVTIPVGYLLIARMLDLGNGVIRIYQTASDKIIYYRDFNATTFTFVGEGKLQITISGNAVAQDCTTLAAQQHLENTYGNTSADYNGLMPLFRSNDTIEIIGGTWYTAFEFTQTNDYTGKYVMLANSTDNGLTWNLQTPIENTARKYGELTVNYLNGTWHGIMRGNNGSYMYSNSANGNTWVTPVVFNMLGLGTRHSVSKTTDKNGIPIFIIAYNKKNEINGHRTTLGIVATHDFVTYRDISVMNVLKSAHYPSIQVVQGIMYMIYSTGLKGTNTNDRDSIMFTKFSLFNI